MVVINFYGDHHHRSILNLGETEGHRSKKHERGMRIDGTSRSNKFDCQRVSVEQGSDVRAKLSALLQAHSIVLYNVMLDGF
mmetsp:Transcript_164571/g.316055  ORF Transcript_164571/g.316055 Transcript_164571/m.316055 type:complete len:81 (+) Transcript_164571:648-890(+)